jgi:hypothetical protein
MAALDQPPFPPRPAPAAAAPARDPRDSGGRSLTGRGQWIFFLFVSLFAFLLASFPARNSDLWAHLAAGRRLAQGDFSGASPTWLYDLLSYGAFSAFGGGGLVLLKALLVAGLALVLMRLSRAGQFPGLAAGCVALALLAVGTRLLIQPVTASYLFLALALWLSGADRAADLQKDNGSPSAPANPWLPPWTLLALFVVWANVDGWFVLGLVTVALLWLGQALDRTGRAGGSRGPSGGEGILPVASRLLILAAACLLNPNHVHAFSLPERLGWFAPAWSSAAFQEYAPSPFQGAYLARFSLSPVGLAYVLLLGLGLLSFALNRARWSWQRVLPWLGLALASGFDARAVPFFAVLAGPALAWNLGEWSAARAARRGQRRLAPRLTTGLAVGGGVLGVAALAGAWTGWLRASPFGPPQWDVELPPALEGGAATVRRWRDEGKLRPGRRGLYLSPEVANAFAWFYPEAEGVLDARLAAAFVGRPGAPRDLAERLRAARVDHVIVCDRDRQLVLAALARAARDPDQWPLLHIEGDLSIFGWRDPADRAADPFRGLELDLNRLAFRPADDRKAPEKRPAREPVPRRWWEAFWKSVPPHALDSDEATRHVLHAEALRLAAPYRFLTAWDAAQAIALRGAAPGWTWPGGLLDAGLRVAAQQSQLSEVVKAGAAPPPLTQVALRCMEGYSLTQDSTPPALLFLAVRAARRALAANPDDAEAHLALGESYLRLLDDTRERVWARRVHQLPQLRRAQAITALNHAAALKPGLAQAHLRLGRLYEQMGYLDLALRHLRTFERLGGEGVRPEHLDRLGKRVAEGEKAYAAEAGKYGVREKAILAFQKGLIGKARDVLLGSDVAAFGAPGMKLELELLLWTGRAEAVRKWTDPEQKASLGAAEYHWLRAQAFAAAGDYGQADAELAELATGGHGQGIAQARAPLAVLIGRAILDGQPLGVGWYHEPWRAWDRSKLEGRLVSFVKAARQEANANVIRGLLALEQGNTEEAEVAFRLALAVWKDEAAAASGAGLEFSTRPIAEGYLRLLEKAAD